MLCSAAPCSETTTRQGPPCGPACGTPRHGRGYDVLPSLSCPGLRAAPGDIRCPGCSLRARADAHPDTHSYADAYRHAHPNAYPHSNPHAHADTHTNRHAHSHTDAYQHSYPHTDRHANFDTNAHANSDTHQHADPNVYAYANSDTHPSPHQCSAHPCVSHRDEDRVGTEHRRRSASCGAAP